MQKEIKALRKARIGYIATIDLKSRPRVRGITIAGADEEKLTFVTSNQKNLYKQLEKNPYAEYIAKTGMFSTLRASGEVTFQENKFIKSEVVASKEILKRVYPEAKEDECVVFYILNPKYEWFEPFSKRKNKEE